MTRTAEELAEKFSREWLEAKGTAITNYVAISNQLASRTIAAKAKMIENFTTAMAGSKFEDRLEPYVGSALMGNAYNQALTAKTAITEAEQLKVATDITLKRTLAANIGALISFYEDQATSGEITVPPGVADQGLRAMLIQGINANQYRINSASSISDMYDNTSAYMNTNLGWPEVE